MEPQDVYDVLKSIPRPPKLTLNSTLDGTTPGREVSRARGLCLFLLLSLLPCVPHLPLPQQLFKHSHLHPSTP